MVVCAKLLVQGQFLLSKASHDLRVMDTLIASRHMRQKMVSQEAKV